MDRRWNGEEAECREDEEGREGKGEDELKGPRYAGVGVGPDWTRVSTFLRRSEQEMQEHEGKRERHKYREKAYGARGERKERERIRETLVRRGESSQIGRAHV